MGFSTKECEWKKVNISILGYRLTGLRGFELGKEVEKEYLYGAGDMPIDIQSGNKAFNGSLNLLKHEVDKLNDAAQSAGYEDITDVPHNLIVLTAQYKKHLTDPIRFVTISGLEFTEMKFSMSQGDKMTEVSLPFMGMGLIPGTV